ncbi:MAG: M20 family metallopeptidase [Verrucomicrobiota bacterium]
MKHPEQTIIELLKKLVALQPVTANVEQVNAAVDCVRDFLNTAGVYTRVYELQGRRILYAATRETSEVDYLLNTHLDVVPADEGMFEVTERGDLLLGRGTVDCLGNSALVATLLTHLNGRASVGAIFSTDEEAGGTTTAHMATQNIRARRLITVLDDGAGYAITVAQKGVLNLRLRARGSACHAAEPWEGDNALDRLIDGYAKIRALFNEAGADDPWHNTLAATTCTAGTVANRVPDNAEMTLNIRYIKSDERDSIIETLRRTSGLEIDVLMQCPPVNVEPNTPVIEQLRAHLERELNTSIALRRLNGATDARHFAAHSAPVAILGLPGRAPHSNGEALQIAPIGPYFAALASFFEP